MPSRGSLAATLKRLRSKYGMSQEGLAERAGLSHRTIGDIECGVRRRPRRNTIDAIADGLSLDDGQRFTLRLAATQDGLALPLPRKLFGRGREFSELSATFASPGAFVTITGPPGVGKTALAIAVANDAVERFPGGVAFVALDAIDNDDAILPTIAAALSVEKRGSEWTSAVCERLSEEPTLLILDNVEHLEGVANVAIELVRSVPDLSILATGRASLNVRDERDYHLSPLESSAAIALFVERAASCVQGYTLHERDVRFVERLCNELDGLPLAIELAAMRVRSFSPQELCDRLWELVAQGPLDVPERHRALSAAIGWSYGTLDIDGRRCVQRFHVFAGGATAAAVLAICEVSAPTIDALVRQNILVSEGAGSRRRLRMLSTVREFSRIRSTEVGETSDSERAHAHYYCELAESLSGLSATAIVRFNDCYDVDAENFRKAIRWGLETGNVEVAARTLLAVRYLWVSRGEFAEALAAFRSVSTRIVEILDPHLRWLILDVTSYFLSVAGENEGAQAYQDQARDLAHRLVASEAMMVSLMSDARLHHFRGENTAAIELCRRVIGEYGEGEDLKVIGLAHANLGYNLIEVGEIAEGLQQLELADRYYRTADDDHHRLSGLQSIAYALIDLGRLPEASATSREAMDIARAMRSPYYLAMAYVNAAHVAVLNGDFEQAKEYLCNALDFWTDSNYPLRLGECYHTCSLYFDAIGQPREAVMLHVAGGLRRKKAGFSGLRSSLEKGEDLQTRLLRNLGEATFQECGELGRTLTTPQALELLQNVGVKSMSH